MKEFALMKGNCQLYNGQLAVYGLLDQKQKSMLRVYFMDDRLNLTDSVTVEASKGALSYLQLSSDTLHGFLNIYSQKNDQKSSNVFRFNKKHETVAIVGNIDIARLNNTQVVGNSALYERSSVYSIKTETDTSGKQFYLNKYEFKSEVANFEYAFKWQFPFERKNISLAHVFYADKKQLFMYVVVNSGLKSGQWLLKIKSENGTLLKATKLNDKGEKNRYQFGTFYYDGQKKSMQLIGQKFTEAQFNSQNKLSVSNAPFAVLYSIGIDSLGDILEKNEFKVPINLSQTGAKKNSNSFIARFNQVVKTAEGGYSIESDIYKSPAAGCYYYANSIVFNLGVLEEKPVLEKCSILANPMIEQYYFTADKLDMNGKLCADSLNQLEKTIFFQNPTFPVKVCYKQDDDRNGCWILTKSNAKKNSINYSILAPVKKIYQVQTLEEFSKSSYPKSIPLSSKLFLIGSQPEEGRYQIKIYPW